MSLLPTVNAANDQMKYFMENIGGSGATNPEVPTIKGTPFGTIRVGNPANGLILNGQTSGAGNIRGGGATSVAGSFLSLGASTAQPSQITLSDTNIAISAPLLVTGAGNDLTVADDINLGGDLVFANGATGASITGFYSAVVAVAGSGAVTNPSGLTAGTYVAVYAATGAGNENAQPSGVFYWSGTAWVGNAVSFNFTAGAPNCAIGPVAGGATLNIGGASVPGAGNVYFRKILG
jgi:hypothetical protein